MWLTRRKENNFNLKLWKIKIIIWWFASIIFQNGREKSILKNVCYFIENKCVNLFFKAWCRSSARRRSQYVHMLQPAASSQRQHRQIPLYAALRLFSRRCFRHTHRTVSSRQRILQFVLGMGYGLFKIKTNDLNI